MLCISNMLQVNGRSGGPLQGSSAKKRGRGFLSDGLHVTSHEYIDGQIIIALEISLFNPLSL